MRVHSIPTSNGEIVACSRRDIDELLGKENIDWISFGTIGRHFLLDRRAIKIKKSAIKGTVVAKLTFSSQETFYICLYPIAESTYGEGGKANFKKEVLPLFRKWIEIQKEQAGTAGARSGHRSIIAEWVGSEHRIHGANSLDATN